MTIGVETTLRSAQGEVERSSSSFDMTVVPEDDITLHLDIGICLPLLAPEPPLRLTLEAGMADLAAGGLIGAQAVTDPQQQQPVPPSDPQAAPVVF